MSPRKQARDQAPTAMSLRLVAYLHRFTPPTRSVREMHRTHDTTREVGAAVDMSPAPSPRGGDARRRFAGKRCAAGVFEPPETHQRRQPPSPGVFKVITSSQILPAPVATTCRRTTGFTLSAAGSAGTIACSKIGSVVDHSRHPTQERSPTVHKQNPHRRFPEAGLLAILDSMFSCQLFRITGVLLSCFEPLSLT